MSINFDDLDTPLTKSTSTRMSNDEIQSRAHIANGGTEMFDCPKCRGTGQTRWGACFSCQGKGKRSKRSLAASQAKVTREQNRANWAQDNADAVAYGRKRADKGSTFYASLLDSLSAHGTWTENQLALIRRDMAKDAEFFAKRDADRKAAAPAVEMSAIEALFATATNNDIKRPVFRADGIEISLAPANGRNAGALYVKTNGDYAGKIVGGKFHAVREAPADTLSRLQAVAADPLAESVKYARRSGACGMCNRMLVDPVSIRAGIGPICADKWGLDWRRDLARDSLAEEAKS